MAGPRRAIPHPAALREITELKIVIQSEARDPFPSPVRNLEPGHGFFGAPGDAA